MNYKNLNSDELKQLIKNKKNILLIDVRTQEEFEKVNIETSINIPLQDLLYNLDQLQDYHNQDIVIYCRSGRRSITACNLLAMEGFNKLYNLELGIEEYF